jgi:hypothetical protein
MGFPSNHGCGNPAVPCFQPSQIVGLEHETSCLYAEVVQVIESRQSCWVRPLMLVFWSEATQMQHSPLATMTACYDLRHDSDLVLPLTLFRVALDVEVLPWLADLYIDDRDIADHEKKASGHQLFREFIQKVWQAHPEVFQAPSRSKKA